MDNQIKVYAKLDIFSNFIDLIVRSKDENGVLKCAPFLDKNTFIPIEIGRVQNPTLSIPYECGQMLMDQLWSCGLRPTEGKGSAGALAATENHLKDLQKITFNLLKIEE